MTTLGTWDYAIICIFLVLTLAIGIYAGRGVKNIQDYGGGNQTFGTATLVLTLLATKISGINLINTPDKVSLNGIIAITMLGRSIAYLLTGFFIAPNAVHFRKCMTLGDLMEGFYGQASSWIAGILSLLRSSLICGINLVIIGTTCEALLGIRASWVIIGSGLFLALYMAHGGVKAVIATDLLQFGFITLCIPLLGYFMVTQVGGVKYIFTQIPPEKLAIWTHPKLSYHLVILLIWILPAGFTGTPTIQRMLLGQTKQQLRHQYLIASAYNVGFNLVILFIGLSGFLLYPDIGAKKLVITVIHDLFPYGFKGLLVAGIPRLVIFSV